MRKNVLVLAKAVFLLFVIIASGPVKGQTLHPDSLMIKVEQIGNYLLYRHHDTSYIENHSSQFTFKLIGVNKYNYFKVKDSGSNVSARFRPDRRLNLGFGISYKWFAFDLAFNLGIEEDSDFENSKLIDLSGTIFSSRQFVNVAYQYYYGYQMTKVSGIPPEKIPESNIRDDIRTVFFGLQYFFVFDYDKYSLKASFIHNEIQKKSAGSFLIGAGFRYYNLGADSTVVPVEFHDDFHPELHFTDLNTSALNLGFGYIYTLVWKKHFYATVSFIPGIGINLGDYKTNNRSSYNTHLYLGFKTMNSIGYNTKRFFAGLDFSNDLFQTRIEKQLKILTGHGKAKVFFGYRFK